MVMGVVKIEAVVLIKIQCFMSTHIQGTFHVLSHSLIGLALMRMMPAIYMYVCMQA